MFLWLYESAVAVSRFDLFSLTTGGGGGLMPTSLYAYGVESVEV